MTRPATSPKPAAKKAENPQATRETVESIVIAVILAFLFRGFVAEAFVIPTGSMAPTLMGRHIDVLHCPDCRYGYQTGASEENDGSGIVEVTYCPICRFPKELQRDTNPDERSFTGDRILVSKYQYELNPPERWDVIVFKFPQNAKQNYIKRLIGLPNELVRIYQGDIYIGKHLFDIDRTLLEVAPDSDASDALLAALQSEGLELADATIERIAYTERPDTVRAQRTESMWQINDSATGTQMIVRLPRDGDAQVYSAPQIARKPPKKERALLQVVHDTAYPGKLLVLTGWPSRWQDRSVDQVWREDAPGKYLSSAKQESFGWLRYRHIYPSDNEWHEMVQSKRRPAVIARGEGALISDYYAYNDRISVPGHRQSLDRMPGHHWVGDLAVEADVEVRSDRGELALDLVEAGVHYRCSFDLATGKATLSMSDGSSFISPDGTQSSAAPTCNTAVRGRGKHKVRFVNADDQLRLWVDGDVMEFDGPTTYQTTGPSLPTWSEDDPGDLAPVGVGARGAIVRLERLKVLRDVYYVAVTESGSDYSRMPSDDDIEVLFRSPEQWARSDLFRNRRMVEFVIGDQQFFPLGDNSPQSADGRMWDDEPYFTDDMLIGKAMLIYWPHGWHRPIPYWPNFSRMQLIH